MNKRKIYFTCVIFLCFLGFSCSESKPVFNFEEYQYLKLFPQTMEDFQNKLSNEKFEIKEKISSGNTKIEQYYFVTCKNKEVVYTFKGYSRENLAINSVEIVSKEYESDGVSLIGKRIDEIRMLIPSNAIYDDTPEKVFFNSKNYMYHVLLKIEKGIVVSYKIGLNM